MYQFLAYHGAIFSSLFWGLSSASAIKYDDIIPSSQSCPPPSTLTIFEGTVTSTVTDSPSFIDVTTTITVDSTFSASASEATTTSPYLGSYVARGYPDYYPLYNSTVPSSSTNENSTFTLTETATEGDGCLPVDTTIAPSTVSTTTTPLITRTFTSTVINAPTAPSNVQVSPSQTLAQEVPLPSSPQSNPGANVDGDEDGSSIESGESEPPELPQPDSPGFPQAVDQPASSDSSPSLDALDVPQAVGIPGGTTDDESQPGSGGSSSNAEPGAVIAPSTENLQSSDSDTPLAPGESSLPETPSDGTETISSDDTNTAPSEVEQFTGAAHRITEHAGKSMLSLVAAVILFWL